MKWHQHGLTHLTKQRWGEPRPPRHAAPSQEPWAAPAQGTQALLSCLAASSDFHSPPETPRFQRWGWLGPLLAGSAGLGLCSSAAPGSHLHASPVHLDYLRPQPLDPAQEDLLVFCQSDPQAEDVSAKGAPHQPGQTSPDHPVP